MPLGRLGGKVGKGQGGRQGAADALEVGAEGLGLRAVLASDQWNRGGGKTLGCGEREESWRAAHHGRSRGDLGDPWWTCPMFGWLLPRRAVLGGRG